MLASFRPDAFQENAGGFVSRVLGDELAFKGPFQDGLPEPVGSLQVRLNLRLEFVNN